MVRFKVWFEHDGRRVDERIILHREEARRYGLGLERAYHSQGRPGTVCIECTDEKGHQETYRYLDGAWREVGGPGPVLY